MDRHQVEARAILLTKVGSHSYGINTSGSDEDYKGIFVADKEYYFGLKNIEQKDKGWLEDSMCFPKLNGIKDLVFYELRKYLKLAKDANPNILELLFESPKFYQYVHHIGQKLLDRREIFLSKKIRYSYSGYAYAQIRKIKSHRKWLLDPPGKKPVAEDYGLTDSSALDKSEEKAFITFLWMLIKDRIEYVEEQQELYDLISDRIDYKGVINNNQLPLEFYPYLQNLTNASDRYMDLLRRTQAYRQALHHWKSYQSWLKNRNPQRAELEAKCGFDAKHGAHCIRLARMGNEILTTGKVNVDRRGIDAEELLAIRLGNVAYDVVLAEAEKQFAQLEHSYEISKLPYRVDDIKINQLAIALVEEFGWS
ncbi:MAG: nucleotidyltransferase domain-containing protein [Cyanobacteria bacterium J06623_7]